jgi:hypothetical protein
MKEGSTDATIMSYSWNEIMCSVVWWSTLDPVIFFLVGFPVMIEIYAEVWMKKCSGHPQY